MFRLLAPMLAAFTMLTTLATTPAYAQEDRGSWLDIEVGKSVTVTTPKVPSAIAVTDADPRSGQQDPGPG